MTAPVIAQTDLQPGDVLLYRPKGVFGWVIRFHTGYKIGHVEVYVGNGQSVASRDGVGVDVYPWRNTELAYVLRPTCPFNLVRAMAWFTRVGKGQPYGWLDLLQFCGYDVEARGMVCSPCATYMQRAGEIPVFGDRPAETIKPGDFLLIPEFLRKVWSDDVGNDREVSRAGSGVVSQ